MRRRSRSEDLYADEKGDDKLAAQQHLATAYWLCCGEAKDGPHHVGCSKYEPAVVPEVHPDQSSIC